MDSTPLASSAELRSQAWWIGYGHPFRTISELNQRTLEILAAIKSRDEHTMFWCLSPLREAAHLLENDVLEEFLLSWLRYGQTYPAAIENTLLTLDRIYVSGTSPIQRFIRRMISESSFYRSLADDRVAAWLRPTQQSIKQSLNTTRRTGRRVGLVVPNFLSGKSFRQPPLDLLLAVTVLRENGFECELFDERVTNRHPQELVAHCQNFDYIILTTSPYDQVQTYYVDYRLVNAFRTARILKEQCYNSKLVLCGSHPSVRPDLAFAETNADYIVRGEVEEAITDLLVHLSDGTPLLNDNIVQPGTSIEPAAVGIFNQFGRSSKLERLPAYDLINFDNYYGDGYRNGMPFHKKRAGAVIATRGCPYSCDFCFNYWGRQVHKRSVTSVIDELNILEQKYYVSTVFFIDFTFTIDRKWVLEFCSAYRDRKLRIPWSCETRPDLVDVEMAREMAAAGCTEVWLGAESFSQDVVERSGKGFSVAETLAAVESLRAAGLAAHTFIMIGLPGESLSTLNSTVRQLHQVKTPYTQSVIVATPRFGTKYFEMAKVQYPHLQLDSSFYGVGAIKGLVENDLTPSLIQDAVSLLAKRTDVFQCGEPPTLNTH